MRYLNLKYINVALLSFSLFCTFITATFAQKAPFLNNGGLPPFFASMQKHEVMVQVQFQDEQNQLLPAPKGLQVGFRILAQGAKIRDYFEQTDEKGRAFFLGIPSNPEVQMAITYEVWADYEGVRFAYELEGFPKTENKDVLLEDFDPNKRLPENRITLKISRPRKGIEGLEIHHSLIEFHPDEDSLLVIHEMQLYNRGKDLLDLSHQKNGGLRLPCPDGAKHPQLQNSHEDDLEVRGASLYYTGALPPNAVRQIRWYYNIPYQSNRFHWSQAMPVPTTIGMIVAAQFKKPQHQETIKLGLSTDQYGEAKVVSAGPDRNFASIRISQKLNADQPLTFFIENIPAPPVWKRYFLIIGTFVIILMLLMVSKKSDQDQMLSREYLLIEQNKLLNALARMETGVKKGHITEQRYIREKEAIEARLVSIYQALAQIDQKK
jgi:hypothetical protein